MHFFPIAGFFNKNLPKNLKTFSIFALILITLNNIGQTPIETINWLTGKKPFITRDGRVDRLTEALRKIKKDDDTYQIFDWIEGAVAHAFMKLKIKSSTRYVTDQIFKHHLHKPTQQKIINDFINNMKINSPTIIVKSLKHNHPKGKYTTKDLPEGILNFIKENYKIVFNDPEFLIYRLIK